MRLQHFRNNEECGVIEELSPIDENLNYDSDYQVWQLYKCFLCDYYA